MPTCMLCFSSFSIRANVNGKIRNFQRRKYCLNCSPFGSGNRKKLSKDVDCLIEKKKKRHKAWVGNQRKSRKERKDFLITMAGGSCQVCGYNKCTSALSFHHRDPKSKVFTVSSNQLLVRWDKVIEEAKKCDLLCMNCHAERHEKIRKEAT